MLKSHMEAQERKLVAISKIPANSGHPLHKGTPREAFIREFLQSHLPETVAIGTGEIIDSRSKPGEPRNQYDIIVYRRNYPKLDFGGGINGFLIESVIATIEVKSTLSSPDIKQAVTAARNAKRLVPNVFGKFHTGYAPPKVLNFVVAYDGPIHMKTVMKWIADAHETDGVEVWNLPQKLKHRLAVPSPSIDGVFILERGFLQFDNAPISFLTEQDRAEWPQAKWVFTEMRLGNLLLFFLLLQGAAANLEAKWFYPPAYVPDFDFSSMRWSS